MFTNVLFIFDNLSNIIYLGDTMSQILLYLSILPSIVFGIYIYRKDTVEKEPLYMLAILFLLGVASAIFTIIWTTILNLFFPILTSTAEDGYFKLFISVFIGIALIEESFKWIMLRAASWDSKNFTHIYDALLYATFVSLGFATIENIMYVMNYGIIIAIVRAILSVPGHVFFGVFMGYYYGLAKQAQVNKKTKLMFKNIILSILIPIILHGIFDYCLLSNNFIFLFIYFIFIILLYIVSFKKIKQFSKIKRSLKDVICPKCGTKNDGNYCMKCGVKL